MCLIVPFNANFIECSEIKWRQSWIFIVLVRSIKIVMKLKNNARYRALSRQAHLFYKNICFLYFIVETRSLSIVFWIESKAQTKIQKNLSILVNLFAKLERTKSKQISERNKTAKKKRTKKKQIIRTTTWNLCKIKPKMRNLDVMSYIFFAHYIILFVCFSADRINSNQSGIFITNLKYKYFKSNHSNCNRNCAVAAWILIVQHSQFFLSFVAICCFLYFQCKIRWEQNASKLTNIFHG